MSILTLQDDVNKLLDSLTLINDFIEKAEPFIFSEEIFSGKVDMEEVYPLYLQAIARQMNVLDFGRKMLHVPTKPGEHDENILKIADFLSLLSENDLSIVRQMVEAKQNGTMQ